MEHLANSCDPEGMLDLAIFYQRGEGTPRNYSKALELLNRTIGKGYLPSEIQLANTYYFGMGVDKDCQKVAEILQKTITKAKKLGNKSIEGEPMYLYSDLTENGLGVPKDLLKTKDLLLRSAKLGYIESIV